LEQRCVRADSSLTSIVGSAVDGVVTLDTELRVLSWSPAAEAATALRAADAVGRGLAELYPDFEKAGFLAPVQRTLREQKTGRHEGFYHDGREEHAGWYSVTSYPFETGVMLIVRNLTEQYRVRLDWRRSEARLRALLANPGLVVSLKDREFRYRLANAPALRTLGLVPDAAFETKRDSDLLKKPIAELLAEHDRKALAGDGPVELDLALPDAVSPESAWYRLVKTQFRDLDGDVMGVLTVGWDVSRQVHAYQELARRRAWLEKLLAEHGRLADEAAGELKRWQA
ncbi:MAG TPA: PAS domain S-box protein, partial [candidate division WOR-3 bacterium]|nr:PAS domain S-box protein [candidate division WOR-3 bacterium]